MPISSLLDMYVYSQAPLCHYTLRTISSRAEGTFGRLRYFLGGDRPSQTAHQTLSSPNIRTDELEIQCNKGGISTGLHRDRSPGFKVSHLCCAYYTKLQCQATVKVHGSFCPAAGIRHLYRTCNFTEPIAETALTSYTIHAGRNLPDKEFRYLRTVIVTAAVYQGLDSTLLPHLFEHHRRLSQVF